MAIRRSPKFRFDYFLRSLPVDSLGRRCEHLMRAAVKEVEDLEKRASEAVQIVDGKLSSLMSVKELKQKERESKANEMNREREKLEQNVEHLELLISDIQSRLKELSKDPNENKSVVDSSAHLKESRKRSRSTHETGENVANGMENDSDLGPDGTQVAFPEYDGSEPPKEARKAFTHFCIKNRKEIKRSLPEGGRKDKEKVNGILRERWLELAEEERQVWRVWASWDKKRYARDLAIYEKKGNSAVTQNASESATGDHPKGNDTSDHIPKKKQRKD